MQLLPEQFALSRAESLIDQASTRDAYRLKRQLIRIGERLSKDQPADKDIAKFCSQLNNSIAWVAKNQANTPQIKDRGTLPISQRWDEIKTLINDNQVSIICGHTGSGKTTKIPQICLELGLGCRGRIGHTQPRRIAARTVANRIAEEVNCPTGAQIGYKVRFEEKQSAATQVLLLTDGMLLAEIQQDKFLNNYEVIIIDEAHERSLNIDFLLGYLKQIKDKRPDLKIIITSATIDPEKFSKHFDDAPILTVEGKTYPIETLYRPLIEDSSDDSDTNEVDSGDLHDGICQAVLELDRYHYGDTLIFLPTERDIRDAAESLLKLNLANTEVLSLFARQSAKLQNAIFHPKNKRRIILATNVAETSVTVPRILNVIDSGLARISRYSHRSKIQRLPVEAISQASAEQRKGRCGRIANGVCIRLYSEEDFTSREEFTDPEIKRTNLASVILQMAALGIGQIDNFPFVEPPDSKLINDGYKLLFELLAVSENRRITKLGREMASLPIDPRFSRILLYAKQTHQLEHILPIVAALAIGDFRERPYKEENKADERHRLFADKDSDFIFYLNVFNSLYPLFTQSKNKTSRLAKSHYLSPLRVREWFYLIEQLAELLEFNIPLPKAKDNKLENPPDNVSKAEKNKKHPAYESIHTTLLSGFLDHIGQLQPESKEYLGVRNKRFYIFPGSFVFKKTPKQIVCAEIVESSRVYARQVANIDFAWLVPIAGHLCKTQESEPHWLKSRGNVMAKQTVLLYGLPLITGRLVELAKTDMATAHDIFVRHALVENQLNTQVKAIAKNRASYDKLLKLEEKTRSRDILIDENQFAELYFSVLPDSVFSTHSLEKWFKTADEAAQNRLLFSEDQLLLNPEQDVDTSDYPNKLTIRGQSYALDYEFDPASPRDGVSINIPLSNLNSFTPVDFDYLVPALLPEKVEAIIRSLPKRYRRQFVPIPPYVEKILTHLQANPAVTQEKPLLAVISDELSKYSGLQLGEDEFDLTKIDAHFHMNIMVYADNKKLLDESRDLAALQSKFGSQASLQFSALTSDIFNESYRETFPQTIPETHILKNKTLTTYPALTVQSDKTPITFKIELFDQAELAEAAHFHGVLTFIKERLSKEVRYVKKNLYQYQKLTLLYRSLGDEATLLEDIVDAVIANTCFSNGVPRSQKTYNEAEDNAKQHLFTNAQAIAKDMLQILANVQQIRETLPTKATYYDDIQAQLARLIYPGFIAKTDAKRIVDLVRYTNAIVVRIDKAKLAPQKDIAWQNQLEPYLNKLYSLVGEARIDSSLPMAVQNYAYLLEEFRISLFAQAEIKVSGKVSSKRLDEAFAAIK